MKKLSIFFLMILGALPLVISSCGEDPDPEFVLKLDGENENNAAPLFNANTTYEAAVRFSAALVRAHEGKKVTAIDVYIADVPSTFSVKVYSKGTSTAPGSVLVNQPVTLGGTSNRWQRISLNTPITLGTEEIWVGASVRHTSNARIVGCDPGPAVNDGDWISQNSAAWQTFRNFTSNSVSINWNIRAVVE